MCISHTWYSILNSMNAQIIKFTRPPGVIYPVAVHWAWQDDGWLKKLGFDDFAGGMLVHGLAGTACLVSTIILGPRKGRFEKHGINDINGHSTAVRKLYFHECSDLKKPCYNLQDKIVRERR